MLRIDSPDVSTLRARRRRSAARYCLAAVLLFVLGAIVLLTEPSKSSHDGPTPEEVRNAIPVQVRLDQNDGLRLESVRAGKSPATGSPNEVCGLGSFPASQPIEDIESANALKITQASESLATRLSVGRNPRDQVAGLMLRLMLPNAYSATAVAEAEVAACRTSSDVAAPPPLVANCDQVRQQYVRARRQESIRMAPQVTQLVQLAANTADPAIYAQALHVCQNLGLEVAACNVIKVEQWARLDPDNMQPWLQLAERAYERKDTAALNEALFRASKAKTDRSYANLTVARLLSADHGEVSELELRTGVIVGAGVAAAWVLPGLQSASGYCSVETVADANRRQVCESLANTMLSQSESLVGMAVAARIGARLGWSRERVEAVRDEARALGEFVWLDQMGRPESPAINAEDCAMYQRTASRLARAFEVGEKGAARELALQRGLSLEDVTQAYLRERAKRKFPAVAPQPNASTHAQPGSTL